MYEKPRGIYKQRSFGPSQIQIHELTKCKERYHRHRRHRRRRRRMFPKADLEKR